MNNEQFKDAQGCEPLEEIEQAKKAYAIHNLKTGRLVAWLNSDGTLASDDDDGDAEAIALLKKLLQREITVREPIPGPAGEQAGQDDDDYDPFPEENMCYFGVVTFRPGEANYLAAFARRLPYISYYEARPL